MEIQRAALGREALIGDLYDIRTDQFCDEQSIFPDGNTPKALVTTTPAPSVKCKIWCAKHRSDKCKKFGLQTDLQLSVLTMDIRTEGSARCLAADVHEEGKTTIVLLNRFQELVQKLDLECEDVKRFVAQDSVANSGATHVVTEVIYGLESVCTLSFFADNAQHGEDLAKEFSEEVLQTLSDRISNGQASSNPSGIISRYPNVVQFFTDVPSGTNERQPKTLDDYGSLLRTRSKRLSGSRGNKQKTMPVAYTLVPLHSINSSAGDGTTTTFPDCIRVFDQEATEKILSLLNSIEDWMHGLGKFYSIFESSDRLFNRNTADAVQFRMNEIKGMATRLKNRTGNYIKEFRNGRLAADAINDVLEEGRLLWTEKEKFLTDFAYVGAKLDYLAKMEAHGVYILENAVVFEHLIRSEEAVFFATNLSSMDEMFEEKSIIFERLYSEGKQCILIDTDVHQLQDMAEGSIAYYSRGKCIEKDLCKLFNLIENFNVIKFKDTPKKMDKKPHPRVGLNVACPKSFTQSGCDKSKREWLCYECKKQVEYGFNEKFYCECGESSMSSALWCCQDHCHGMMYEGYKSSDLVEQLNEIKKPKEFNVLLLGETGGGKSTWINSIANYVKHETLKAALDAPLTCLIACSFSMQQSRGGARKKILVGDDDNESFETGQSSTQKPKTYAFMYKSVLIRLIDVPGVADTRGIEHDKKNFDLILQELRTIDELHAICVLMNPDIHKLTAGFKYCISELFTHMHKSAANNIVFCFTKTRQTFYTVGQTYQLLEVFLDKFAKERNVHIPLVEDTMYCFDNEAFRLLCAIRNGVQFTAKEHEDYQKSWDVSAAETIRFLDYLVQREPHRTREMLGLNEARRIIIRLTVPLAEITESIDLNLRLLEKEKEAIKHLDARVANLKEHVERKEVILDLEEINYPQTVCANKQCIETTTTNSGITYVQYKTICHERCSLSGIETEEYPQKALMNCAAMSKGTCKMCGCACDWHVHVRYLSKLRETTVIDEEVEKQLREAKDNQAIKDGLLKSYDKRGKLLEERRKKITETCVKFGAFLAKNSILPYNDSLIQYLKMSIRIAEQEEAQDGNVDRVTDLKKYLAQYEEELKILKSRIEGKEQDVTLEDVMSMKEELFSMNSEECNIPAYLKAVEHAADAHYERKDYFFEVGHQTPVPRERDKYFKPIPQSGSSFGAQYGNPNAYSGGHAQEQYYYNEYDVPQETDRSSIGGPAYAPRNYSDYGSPGSQCFYESGNPGPGQQGPSTPLKRKYIISPSGDAALPPHMNQKIGTQGATRFPTDIYQNPSQEARSGATAQAPYGAGKLHGAQEAARFPPNNYQNQPQEARYAGTTQASYGTGKHHTAQEAARPPPQWEGSRESRDSAAHRQYSHTNNISEQQEMNRSSAFHPVHPQQSPRSGDDIRTSRQSERNTQTRETVPYNIQAPVNTGYSTNTRFRDQREADTARQAGYTHGSHEPLGGAVNPAPYQSGRFNSAQETNRAFTDAGYAPQQFRGVALGPQPWQASGMSPGQGVNRYPPGQQVFEQYREYPPEAYRQVHPENWSPTSGLTQPEYGNFSTGSASRDEVPTNRRKQHSRSGETEEGKDKKSGGWFPFSWRR